MATGFVRAYLASTALALFVLITLKLGVDVKIAIEHFITAPGVIKFAVKDVKLSSALYVSLITIADIFIVYRVYAVWSRSLLVTVVPCLLLVTGVASGGLATVNTSELAFEEPRSAGYFTTFYCTTLALNVLCTALIAFKLYTSERKTKFSSSLRLRWTSVIVIESAAIYLACVVVGVVCNVVKADSLHLIVVSSTPSIIGLAFSLILVRIGSGRTPNKTFTSIAYLSRGSILRFGTHHLTVRNGDEGIEYSA
ncbi:hypothetical protein PQX77_001031 [Marasmius sp. AFHP31]|nr:hypothetical protein PQX77_001031 [Marasmius sp. AFHP31]